MRSRILLALFSGHNNKVECTSCPPSDYPFHLTLEGSLNADSQSQSMEASDSSTVHYPQNVRPLQNLTFVLTRAYMEQSAQP